MTIEITPLLRAGFATTLALVAIVLLSRFFGARFGFALCISSFASRAVRLDLFFGIIVIHSDMDF